MERPSNGKTLGFTIKLENVRITLRYTQKIIKEDLQLVKNCDKPFNPDLEVLETLGNQDPAQCSFWTSRVVFKRQGLGGVKTPNWPPRCN